VKQRHKSFLHRGFSLVELTMATVIFSMGLGGLSLMLLVAVSGTTGARFQTMAAVHANSLAEMILMNSDAVGHYINPLPGQTAPCLGASQLCDAGEIGAGYMNEWHDQLGADLPNGKGLVCLDGTPDDGNPDSPSCDGAGNAVIKVFWQEPSNGDPRKESGQRLVSRLPLP